MSGAWRQEWAAAVRQCRDLSMTAKMVAQVLALDFANRETGQCNPRRATLADHLSVSEATIKRALAELTDAGWLGRTGATARNRTVNYTFLSPGKVVAFGPRDRSNAGHERPAIETGTRVKSDPNAGQICTRPYKGRNLVKNQGARATRAEHEWPIDQIEVIERQSHRVDAWNRWLTAHGWPELQAIGPRLMRREGSGWLMPFAMPPGEGDSTKVRITERLLTWAMADQRTVASA